MKMQTAARYAIAAIAISLLGAPFRASLPVDAAPAAPAAACKHITAKAAPADLAACVASLSALVQKQDARIHELEGKVMELQDSMAEMANDLPQEIEQKLRAKP